ncbi:MAG: c-type cytochrome domain-containing protein [Leptospiraceae bacterium]|nr:c-type cytochrome domain-containing protein [Leptospiraceae bacterium]
MKPLLIFLILFVQACTSKSSDDDKNRFAAIAILLSRSTATTATTTTTTFTCTGTTTFANVTSVTQSRCASCHSGSTLNAGYDVTSYSSSRARVTPGNPSSSALYSKITTGSMAANSNTDINRAVYCWILGGAVQ